MFGEYGLYREGRLFALICDDRLFIKLTPEGRGYAGELSEDQPYPGAKPCLLVPGDRCEDADWLAGLVEATVAALPTPQPKKPRSKPRNSLR